jgi:hypothetical protein
MKGIESISSGTEAFAMWKSIAGWVSHQVRSERDQLLAAGGLPFSELLPASYVEGVLGEEQVGQRECLYSPLVTLWTFLSQTLCADHSCRQAVARLRAFLTADGQRPCAPVTGPYCKARQRIPENVCARLMGDVGQSLHQRVSDGNLLNGRPVKLVDGTTVSMPDTGKNQAAYPQSRSQKPGLGFPIARVVALLSLASGAVLDLAIGQYRGKNTGETALFRQLWRSLFPGDVVVGDRYFASYWDLTLLAMCGVDSVYRQHQLRLSKRHRMRRLGSGDWLLRLLKPQRPSWMDRASYQRIPPELIVREVFVRVRIRGWRVRQLTLVTTLCDPFEYSVEELVRVYHARWQAEVDIRTIKITMHMDVLRCKTPEMVRKEIWMHLLAYNLIRTVMAEAAQHANMRPRTVSFKGALQTLTAYRSLVEQAAPHALPALYDSLLTAIASHVVGNRPHRYEPRAIKRRPKEHDLLTIPRHIAKRRLAA